ncbi:MAG TPA: protein kinase [Gemmatimonadales bacterium]|nr:protein kinase [Gemmatimonadales bacterium]
MTYRLSQRVYLWYRSCYYLTKPEPDKPERWGLVTDIRERLQADLEASYAIERELGRGGMATVYLARDLRHDRPVALKVLHPELAASLGAERFLREIKLAARLQHPHILTVHDSGEVPSAGGAPLLWFTMPYVEGETLRSRLNREKQLPLDDALRIARQAADALDYAHRHGVVHRDIKPENILLTGSHALVADFGIGKALGSGAGDRLTETGLTIGTPAYMSPEQASGDCDLDGRTDVYSLGAVLYEMLAGQPPFSGPTAQAVLTQRFTQDPRPVRALRATVPEPLEQAVAKALARAPADRFLTAAEFGRAIDLGTAPARSATERTLAPVIPDLREQPKPASGVPQAASGDQRNRVLAVLLARPSLIILALGFLLGLGVLFAWRRARPSVDEAGPGGTKGIAVLPFENLGAPDDEYFADGMTDAVRGKLASVPGLQVIARTSSAPYKKTAKTSQQIAQELGVHYILTATVRWEKSGGTSRVQVSPELVQVGEGAAPTTKWQQPFDATMTDVFQVQADIASRVAQALDVALGATARETLGERPTKNLAAYDAFLKGNEAAGGLITATPSDLRRAISYYERAVALDSTFAFAWAQLSRAHGAMSPPTPADIAASRTAAERARALAPGAAQTYLALGDYYSGIERNAPKALEQYNLGRKVAPNDGELLTGVALVERSQGNFEQSMASLRQALALDPRSVGTARRLAQSLLWLKRYPEAMAAADRALALDPQSADLNETKAMILLAQGDLPGARGVLGAAVAHTDATELVAYVANYWDLFWVLDDAQQQLLLRLTPGPFGDDASSWAICIAQTYALRKDTVRARAYADTARAAGEALLKEAPDDAAHRMAVGLAYAYMGRKAEAIREGERAVAQSPVSTNAYYGVYFLHQLARIYALVGEPEKAIDQLEQVLKLPYYLSPAWLRIDPTLEHLRKNPRFQKLVAGAA